MRSRMLYIGSLVSCYVFAFVFFLMLSGCPSQKPVVKDAGPPITAESLLSDCENFEADGKYIAAEKKCQESLGRKNITRTHKILANIYTKQGKHGKAAASFESFLKDNPNDNKTRLRLSNAYMKSGQASKALPLFEGFFKADPKNIGIMNNLVMLYRKAKKFDKAEKLARLVLAREPKNKQAYRNLILLYLDWKKYNQAELVATVATSIYKFKDPGIYNNFGMVYLKKKDLTKASARFRKALKLDKYNIQAHMNLGTIAVQKGRWKTAHKHFNTVLRKQPEHIYANRNYAVALMGMNKTKEAKGIYEKLLKLRPNDPEATFQLGVIQFRKKKIEDKKASEKFFDNFLANPKSKDLVSYASAKKFITQVKKRLKILQLSAPPPKRKKVRKPTKNINEVLGKDDPNEPKEGEGGKDGAKPGTPGAKPGTPGAKPGTPGAKPGTPGAKPGAKPGDVKKATDAAKKKATDTAKDAKKKATDAGKAVKNAVKKGADAAKKAAGATKKAAGALKKK